MTRPFDFLRSEAIKLHRSYALLLVGTTPVAVAVILAILLVNRREPLSWDAVNWTGALMWGFFMLPMSITALTVLMAQIEHGCRGWGHAMVYPAAKWWTYAAKAALCIGLVWLMTAFAIALVHLTAAAVEIMRRGQQFIGAFSLILPLKTVVALAGASMLATMIQLWLALQFRHIMPGLILGVSGTFATVIAYRSHYALLLPWAAPANAVNFEDAGRAGTAFAVGLIGGAVSLALMLAALNRKQFPS
jgi:hypothetical protein